MNYDEAVNYYQSPKFSKILGNDALLSLLEYLGNPQNNLSYIHIAGTNGKGSVSLMLSTALIESGLKVGLFTSPYIETFNERIKINNKNIPDTDLISCTETVKSAIDELKLDISAFAKITAAAFVYFSKMKCDIVVLETGLGGRLDATNVVIPKVSVITKIGLDHTEYLGDTIEKIATEKCGIIKNNIPVVTTSSQTDEALKTIKMCAKSKNSKLYIADKSIQYDLGLKGEYQKENAGIAVCVLELLGISKNSVINGLKQSFWPARFEFLRSNLLLDGAHNPDGISALLSSLTKLNRPVHFVIAMMRDKNYEDSAKLIESFGAKVTVTQIDMPRCISAKELAEKFECANVIENPIDAVNFALNNASQNELVCVLGSLYFAGKIRKNFVE